MSQLVELCNGRAERGIKPLTLRGGEGKLNSKAGVPLGEEGAKWGAHPGQRDKHELLGRGGRETDEPN